MNSVQSAINQVVETVKNKDYSRALGNNVTKLFQEMLFEMEQGVIYIHGPPKSGKSTLAKRIAYNFYKRGMKCRLTYNFVTGYKHLSENEVLIIEDQHSKEKGNNVVDEFGLENYKIYAHQRHAVAIVIGLKSYTRHSVFHLQCEAFKEFGSTPALQLLLRVMDSYLGHVFVPHSHSSADDPEHVAEFYEMLEWAEDNARIEFYKTALDALLETLDEKTEYLIKSIFPSRTLIETRPVKDPEDNAIEGIKLCYYGDVGGGKSTLAKIFYAILQKLYINVYAVKHDRDIMLLYSKGWSADKNYFCQYLHVDDATYSLPGTYESLQQHIRMRHLMNYATGGNERDKRGGLQHGAAVSSIAIHRLTGKAIAPEWRDNFKALFILNLPTLPWDRNYIKGLLQSNLNYDFLVWLNRERNKAMVQGDKKRYHELLGIGVCVTNDEESFPYRLHSCNGACDLPQYSSLPIPTFEGSSLWFNTWEEFSDEIIERLNKHKKITQPTIMDQISRLEKEKLGFLRPEREGGINYAKRVYARVMAHFQFQKNGYLEENFEEDYGAQPLYRPPKPVSIDTVSMVEAKNITDLFFSLLMEYARNNALKVGMQDWIDHIHSSYNQIAKRSGRSKNTVIGNVRNMQEKITRDLKDVYGFLWEKTIWLYFIHVLSNKGYILTYLVDDDEIDQIPVRSNLRDSRELTLKGLPPQNNDPSQNPPLPISGGGDAPLELRWLGGLSEVDFTLDIQPNYYALEAKASSAHSCKSKHPRCDCVIERDKIRPLLTILQSDPNCTGMILHMHPNIHGNQRTKTKAAKISAERRTKPAFSITKHGSVENWILRIIPDINPP